MGPTRLPSKLEDDTKQRLKNHTQVLISPCTPEVQGVGVFNLCAFVETASKKRLGVSK